MLFLASVGCTGTPNPIIGKWTAKEKGGFISLAGFEFTTTEFIIRGTEHYPAKYEINGATVHVVPERAFPMTCTATGADAITCEGYGEFVRSKK